MTRSKRLSLWFVTMTMLGTLFLSHAVAADHANLFVYHRFGDDRYPSTNISLEHFRAHLEILRDGGYQLITLGELVDFLEQGRPLPDRCAVLTIDDAYTTFLTGAMPLLEEYGFRATLFVATGSVGGGGYLNWAQLKQLQGRGIEIGNHSDGHAYLIDRRQGEGPVAWQKRVRDDLVTAQESFSRHLGKAPRLFAYPYGEYSHELVALVRSAGFRAAVGQQSGVVSVDGDRFTLPRFPMGGAFTEPERFREKLRMVPLPVVEIDPGDTVVGAQNPPVLRLQVALERIDPGSLRAYGPVGRPLEIKSVVGKEGLFEVRASEPLAGRRSKYTLTASDREGRQWYWYSHPWVFPRR